MRKLFIMTVRNDMINQQEKYTVERGRCCIRRFMLYPLQDIMIDEHIVTQKKFIHEITKNMSANLDGTSIANVYFNGYNYRKFMNMGNYLG